MGFVVDGYCHSSTSMALDALRADVSSMSSYAAYGGLMVPTHQMTYPVDVDSGGVVRFDYFRLDASGVTDTDDFYYHQLPTCSVAFEDGPMPWGVSSTTGGVVPPMTPELAAAMCVWSLILWGAAWAWRVTRMAT